MSQYLAVEELTKRMNVYITNSLGRSVAQSAAELTRWLLCFTIGADLLNCCRDSALVYLLDSVELKQDDIIPQAIATVARHFQSYRPINSSVCRPMYVRDV